MSSSFTQANKSNEDEESKIEVSTEKGSKRSRDSQNGASAGTGKYQQAPKKQLKITTMWVPSYLPLDSHYPVKCSFIEFYKTLKILTCNPLFKLAFTFQDSPRQTEKKNAKLLSTAKTKNVSNPKTAKAAVVKVKKKKRPP